MIKGQILRCDGQVNATRPQREDVGAIDGNWPTGVEHLQPVPAGVGAEKSRVGRGDRAVPAGGVVRGGGQVAYPTLAIAQRGCIVRLDDHTSGRQDGHLEVINPDELAALVQGCAVNFENESVGKELRVGAGVVAHVGEVEPDILPFVVTPALAGGVVLIAAEISDRDPAVGAEVGNRDAGGIVNAVQFIAERHAQAGTAAGIQWHLERSIAAPVA